MPVDCQVSGRGRVRGRDRCENRKISHGDFGLVVQALHDAAGKQLLSAEIVQDEFAMIAERAGDLLHWFDAGSHGLAGPLVELCDRLHNSSYVAILLMWPKPV